MNCFRLFPGLLMVVLVFLTPCLGAAEKKVETVILPPPMEGTASIGVFDSAGQRVRVLEAHAGTDTLPAALNGWSITWDGKTDDGTTAPAGTYEMRGWIAGRVNVEGVAWHFNDWIDPDAPERAPVRTEQVALVAEGGFIVLQAGPGDIWTVGRFMPDGALLWRRDLPWKPLHFAAAGDRVWVSDGQQLGQLALGDGAWTALPGLGEPITGCAAGQDALWVARGSNLFRMEPAGGALASVSTTPFVPDYLAAGGPALFAAWSGDPARVAVFSAGAWTEIPVKIEGRITGLAAGNGDTFWVMVRGDGGTRLQYFDRQGGLERELDAADGLLLERVAVSGDDTVLALIARSGSTEDFRVVRRKTSENVGDPAATEGVSYWATVQQRSITTCNEFGVDAKTGDPVPRGDVFPGKGIRVNLVANPLNPDRPRSLGFRAMAWAGGVWLGTDDGLPLVPVTADSPERFACVPGKDRAARIFVRQGPAVAEFRVSGLRNMMELTSGPVQWPPGPRLGPDEADVPSTGPASTP